MDCECNNRVIPWNTIQKKMSVNKVESVTVAVYLSSVLAHSWLRQTRPSDEPNGTRTDREQDELLRRGNVKEKHSNQDLHEHSCQMLVIGHNIVSYGCRSQRLICWTPKKMWRRSWRKLSVSQATSRTMESSLLSNTSSSLCAEVENSTLILPLLSLLQISFTCRRNGKWVDDRDHCVTEFCIKRDPKWGGDKIYTVFEEVEKDFGEEVKCKQQFI